MTHRGLASVALGAGLLVGTACPACVSPETGSMPASVESSPATPPPAKVPAPPDAGVLRPEVPSTDGPDAAAPWKLDRSAFRPPEIPDALSFHGWSKDGRKFAFEVAAEGEGTRCGARRWLRVVDASTDRFVAREDLAFPEADRDDCDPATLERRMKAPRERILAEQGILPGYLEAPAALKKTGFWVWTSSGGGASMRFRFETRFVTDDVYSEAAEKGAAYRLVRLDGDEEQVLEPGTRRRPGVIGYRLSAGRVFVAPSGCGFAVFVVRLERAFEGARWSWMANGALLPTCTR